MTAPGLASGARSGTTPARDLIAPARRTLERLAWLRAALAGAGASAAVVIVLRLYAASGNDDASLLAPYSLVLIALLAFVLVVALVRLRAGRISVLRAALWMEERSPTGYARIALAEDMTSEGALLSASQRDMLSAVAAGAPRRQEIAAALRVATRRQLLGPMLFVLAAAAIAVVTFAAPLPRGDDVKGVARTAEAGAGPAAAAPMGEWSVRVVPPAYTGARAQSLGNVTSFKAIAGTRVELRGPGAPPALAVRVLGDSVSSLRVTRGAQPIADNGAWSTSVSVPSASLELRATRGGTSRLLLVDAYTDSIPHVSLERPARDSVLRRAVGSVPLLATLHDDIGLATASFELIVSSGEGERFTARTLTIGAQRIGGARDRALRSSLDLDALKLGPGDVIHLRAVARDGYPLSGREAGSSETRSFRIARASEYDSVAVEPAPPPAVDSSLLSQRMLLMLTERLERRRTGLARPVLVSESQRIARDQAKLRQSVGNVVFQRLTGEQGAEHAHTVGDGHDHGVESVGGKLAMTGGKDANGTLDEGDDAPIVAINKPLLEAYNAMWDAGRALEQAEPRAAIPFMKVALAAIERARAASRLYLRGKPPVVIVDISKVRLTGRDSGRTNERSHRDALSLADAARERRLLTAVALLSSDAAAARDSLAVLRLESVSEAPVFAGALGESLEALRTGRDVTPALLRARRVLGGVVRGGSAAWSRPGGT